MPAEQSARALHQFRAAMESRDVAAVVDSFAPDAVFHSPLTERLACSHVRDLKYRERSKDHHLEARRNNETDSDHRNSEPS